MRILRCKGAAIGLEVASSGARTGGTYVSQICTQADCLSYLLNR